MPTPTPAPVRRPLVLAVALGALTLGGCRTYGAYDSDDRTYAALQQAVTLFAQQATRTRADASALVAAARTDAALAPWATELEGLLAAEDSVVARQRRRLAALDGEGDYRTLNRAYGAVLSEQAEVRDRYVALVDRVAGQPDSTTYPEAVVNDSRYVVVPPAYERIARANTVVSMARALAAARALPRPTPADSTAAPLPVEGAPVPVVAAPAPPAAPDAGERTGGGSMGPR